jgi:hypothetical protein
MRKVAAVSFASFACLLSSNAVAVAQTKTTDAGAGAAVSATPPPPPAASAPLAPAGTKPIALPDGAASRSPMPPSPPMAAAIVKERDREERRTKGGDPDTAELKSGRLMRYGITAGLAAAVHVPFPGSPIRGVGASALPYVAAFPGIWTKSPVTRAYCTAKWVGEDGPENAATAAAVKESIASLREETKRRGGQDLRSYYAPLHDNAHDKEALPTEDAMDARGKVWSELRSEGGAPFTPVEAERELVACSDALAETTGSSDFPAACDTVHVHQLIQAYSGWDTERSNRCAWTQLGGYVGLPFSYAVNDELGGHDASRRHTPFISSGLVFAPSSFVSFLVGLTLDNVTRAASLGSPAHDVTVPAITFGLGGNLDMLGALIPGR